MSFFDWFGQGRHRAGPGVKPRRVAVGVTAAAIAGAALLAAASPASAALTPGSHPGPGQVDTFKDGSVHAFSGWLMQTPDGTELGYCLDAQRTQPLDKNGNNAYTYSSVYDPTDAWLLWTQGTANVASATGSALAWLVHNTTGLGHKDAAPYEFQDYTAANKNVRSVAAITTSINTLKANAAKFRGPYTISTNITSSPTSTSGTVKAVITVKSASGAAMTGVSVALSATGSATGVSGAGKTNSAGQITATWSLANSKSGGVKATASNLPGTSVTLATPKASIASYQRQITRYRMQPTSASGSVSAVRPAAPTSKVSLTKTGSNGKLLGSVTFQAKTANGTVVGSGKTASNGTLTMTLAGIAVGTKITLHEVGGQPAGYQLAKDVTVTSTADGRGAAASRVVDATASKVGAHKQDEDAKGVPGAIIQAVVGGKVLATGTTGPTGNVTLSLPNVAPGMAVTLHESKTPAGFLTATDAKVTSTADAKGTGTATMVDRHRTAGLITLNKSSDADGSDVDGAPFTVTVEHDGTSTPVIGGATDGTIEPTPGHYLTASGSISLNGATTTPVLVAGDKVTFTETGSAPGMLASLTPVVVSGTIAVDGTLELSATNTPQRSLELQKNLATNGSGVAGVTVVACYQPGNRQLAPGEAAQTACSAPGASTIDPATGKAVSLDGWFAVTSLTSGDNGASPVSDPSNWIRPGDRIGEFETDVPATIEKSATAAFTTVTLTGWTGCANTTGAAAGEGTTIACTFADAPTPVAHLVKQVKNPRTGQTVSGILPSNAWYRIEDATTHTVVVAKAGPTDEHGNLPSTLLPDTHDGQRIAFIETGSPAGAQINATPIIGTIADDGHGGFAVTVTQVDAPIPATPAVTVTTVASDLATKSNVIVPGTGQKISDLTRVCTSNDEAIGRTWWIDSPTLVLHLAGGADQDITTTGGGYITTTNSGCTTGTIVYTITGNVPVGSAFVTVQERGFLTPQGSTGWKPSATTKPNTANTNRNDTSESLTVQAPKWTVTTVAHGTVSDKTIPAGTGQRVADSTSVCTENAAAAGITVWVNSPTALLINTKGDVQGSVATSGSGYVTLPKSGSCTTVTITYTITGNVPAGWGVRFQEQSFRVADTHSMPAVGQKPDTVASPGEASETVTAAQPAAGGGAGGAGAGTGIDTGAITGPVDTSTFPWGWSLIGVGLLVLIGLAIGLTTAGRRRRTGLDTE